MKSLLILTSSVAGENSKSTQLANDYKSIWLENNPGGKVTVRDLVANPVSQLSGELVGAYFTPEENRSDQQNEMLAQSNELVAELFAHDDLVITSPMYNFSIPSQLKSYFDAVARVGLTFKYTETGPVGQVTGKKALVITTRGGVYEGTPLDQNAPFVKQFLGFIGITDVEVVFAEGLAMGDDAANKAVADAKEKLAKLV